MRPHRPIPRNCGDYEVRFWSLLDRRATSECWPWSGSRNSTGRGMFSCGKGKGTFLAPRILWLLVTGDDPGKKNVLHRCDHPWCCNPKHLWLGTQRQNVIDMIEKGRKWMPIGEKHGRAKLTDAAVRAIRRSRKNNYVLAVDYGVTNALISMVKRRLIWKHVA
jgi:HNH endonuclease